MTQPTLVYLRVARPGRSVGRWHIAARIGTGPLLTPEADNLDQAHRVEAAELPADVTRRELCRRCFAEGT